MTPVKTAPNPVLVTGARGRVGRALHAVWGANLGESQPILWQSRFGEGAGEVAWEIGRNPPPKLPTGLIVLHLAGKTSGTAAELAANGVLTEAVCRAARDAGARHVFVMSSGAVYAPGPLAMAEEVTPAPVSAYGAAKLAAEQVAARVLQGSSTGLTVLRLGNLAGADALLGNAVPGRSVILDPIAGQAGGPARSYIGPRMLAQVLQALIGLEALPTVLNLAQQPPVAMADLLQARGQEWQFGPYRDGVVPRVVLTTDRLAALVKLPQTSAEGLIADMGSVNGVAAMTLAKRICDLLLALALGVILTLPFGLLILYLLMVEGRPVFYVAERMRAPDRPFALWKLRTMTVVPPEAGVSGGDKSSRITATGRFLRRSRLDEVPQLWNVLKGDMSFVGPRPPLRIYVERFPETYAKVLQSRPGITGLATLVYHRHEEKLLARCSTAAETDAVYARRCVPRKAHIDLIYQRRRTVWMDFGLMALTLSRALKLSKNT